MTAGLQTRLRTLSIAVAGGATVGICCNLEQFWWVALAGAALLSLAAIDTLARPDGWSTTWSTAVVAAGVAAWQCAAMWWVVLAVDTPSAASGRAWGATALGILVGGQVLCIAATWAPLDWLARRRRLVGRGAALAGAGCWLLAFGAASTLRQLSWAGDGLASLSTAAVDAPGAMAWLPIVGAQGFDGLLLSTIGGLTAWTMTRVRAFEEFNPLQLGLGVLLALMVSMSVWLGRTLLIWRRHVRGIEGALRDTGAGGMPTIARTGERELDQIVDALNGAGRRVGEARGEADAMAVRAAKAERLAALGRVAAGIAHEIRNPIAAARLQGENALAGDDFRRREAIGDMLGQIERLDGLVGELLAMTQRVEPKPVPVDVAAFLASHIARHTETAAAKSLTVSAENAAGTASLDPAVIGRVLDNLLTNAIRHAPRAGSVIVAVERPKNLLILTVADTGPGVPADMTERLFEPFVTGRPDGTGLGLSIARELADAHGGRLVLRNASAGAVFALEIPQEASWPPS